MYALHRPKDLSKTSFLKMFSPTHYNCNDERAFHMFSALYGVFRLLPLGGAEIMKVADINIGSFTRNCQSKMSLLVVDFT
jgi:hypothetical protein